MFLEILSEPEHNDSFFLESEEVELSRLSYVILNGNCTLKLLATIMIHALHNSGVSDEALWKSDSSTDRIRFFDTLPSYRNDPLQHFYTLSNMAVVSEVVDKTSYLRRCFLLQSLHIDETPLFEGTVLAIIDEGCLIFITYRQNTTRMCLEYVEFYTQSIGLPVRTVVDKSMIYCLKLVLSQNKLVVKNGRRLCFEGHVLSILSDKDPGDLRNAIEAFCQNDQGSINTDGIFRTSSMVMELDTSDEVARKSSGISPNNTQGQEGPRTGPILIQKSVKELEKHSEELEKCNTTNANLDDVHLERNGSQQECQRTNYAGEPPVPLSNPSLSKGVPRKPYGRLAPNPDTGRRRSSRLQSGNRVNRRKDPLSNTQESMVIYTRHSRQKVYIANSKAAVDWDEDLRPSDDEVERPFKDAEVTSISSPLPGETSFVGSRSAAPGKKRAARGRKLATKRKKIVSSRPTRKNENNTKKATPASAFTEDADNPNHKPGHTLSDDDIIGKLIPCSRERNGGAMAKSAHVELVSDNAIVGCDSAAPQHNDDRTRSLRIQASGENESYSELSTSVTGDNNNQMNTPKCHPTAQGLQGRGRVVGYKLSAAFQQGYPSAGHGGHKENSLEHIQTHNKLANENELDLSDTLYVSVCDGGIQGQHDITESVIERYTIYDGVLPLETPNEQFTSKIEDDLHAECSVQRHTSRSSSFKIDNEEPKMLTQSGGSADSSPLCVGESRSHEEFPFEMCKESLGAAHNTCTSDMPQTTSEGMKSPRVRPVKRKIAALSPDYMRDDPITGDHASENAFREDSRRLVRQHHWNPTKRLRNTPRSTIVDADGSPRLLYHIKSGYMGGRADVDGNPREMSGAGDRSSTSEHVRGIMKDGKNGAQNDELPAFCERNVISGSKHSGTCTKQVKEVLTFQDRLMACTGKPTSNKTPLRNSARSSPNAHLTLERDNEPHATCNSLPGSTVVPDQLSAQSCSQKPSTTADGVLEHTSWQTSLQVLHKRAQSMLLATSEHIIQEIESEKKTINEVLEMYRRDCHRVLDQLFEAQEERIRLCQQQMNSIREHHTEVCQELMQRLERDEQQLRDRMQMRK
ncbi:hypothetical protein AnigIFM63326_006744 [Aspergillus niger]|nr:hypothetical protein AnigIFM63326_006744 [Aspergillus niger]